VDHYINCSGDRQPGYPLDDAALRERILVGTRRSFHPPAVCARWRDRRRHPPATNCPASRPARWSLHGKDDPLVPMAWGTTRRAEIRALALSPSTAWGTTCRRRRRTPARAGCVPHLRQTTAMNTPEQSQLGKPAPYVDPTMRVAAVPLSRQPKRSNWAARGVPSLRRRPVDRFELSWLTPAGKPQVAIAHVTVPCETPNIVRASRSSYLTVSPNGLCFAGRVPSASGPT